MSIVAAALNAANETEMRSVSNKISDVARTVDLVSNKVKDYMETKYLRSIKTKLNNEVCLMNEAVEISGNIQELESRLNEQIRPEYSTVTEELRTLANSLEEARIMCDITKILQGIDKEFDLAFKSQNSGSYVKAAQHVLNIQSLLKEQRSSLNFLEIFESLEDKAATVNSRFSSEGLKMWKAEVSWVICQLDSSRKTTALKVQKSKDVLESLIKTLDLFDASEKQIYHFSQSLINDILIPCIEQQMVVITTIRSDNIVLSVSLASEDQPGAAEALSNLTSVFEFLQQRMNLTIDNNRNFISEVGTQIADKFLTVLTKKCLSLAIPNTGNDFSAFDAFASKVRNFNGLLKQMHFIPTQDDRLDEFWKNVEKEFLEKIVDGYLTRVKEICALNLQDMKIISNTSDQPKKDTVFNFPESLENLTFPQCCVSKSALDLMALVREILDVVVAGDLPLPSMPLKLFCTARECINLYVELTPVVHSQLLESLPQPAALFHNNCFYIAHELVELNDPYKAKYTDQIVSVMSTFVDMVSYVRNAGLKLLDSQVAIQNDTIQEVLSKSGFSHLSSSESPAAMKKSIQECIHQLTFLQTMWSEVLHVHTYNKIMGQLCNSFLDTIISQVCSNRDIEEAVATLIVDQFALVLDALPSLFEEPKEVHRLVKKWLKFNELIYILKGSLVEIGDRWADGKGPLALEFTAEQVTNMIVALFQTSDRRAAILSRIK